MPAAVKSESVMDPAALTLAGVYAEALLGLTPGNDEAEQVADELQSIRRLLEDVEGFEDLLTAALIGRDERRDLVRRIFRGRCSEKVEALLDVMARNDRLGLVREAARQFRGMLDVRQGKVEVKVTTATELDGAALGRIVEALREAVGGEPLLRTAVQPDLLGGAVVRIGDRVFDASIAAELRRLRRSFVERRSQVRAIHEVQG